MIGTTSIDRFVGPAGFLRRGRAVVLLTSLVTAAIGATAGLMIWHTRQSTLEEHQRSMQSMGVVLAEQTARYVQVIDLIVQEVQAQSASLDIKSPTDFARRLGTPEIQAYLAEQVANVPQANAITLIGADGIRLNSSRVGPVVHADVVDRDYYAYFKEHDDPNVFIGSLSKSRVTGELSLFFARRINGPDHQFFGLVLGVVDVNYLSDFYKAASEHLGQTVTLLRRDGTMLMRFPDPIRAVGVKLPQGSPWYARVAEGGGNYVTSGEFNAAPSLVSVHVLHDYPLVVDILMDKTLVFAEWQREAVYIASFALAAAFAFSGLFWVVGQQFHRQVEQNTALEEAAIALTEGQQKLLAYAKMSVDWFWEQDADFRFKVRTHTPFLTASDDTGKTRWELAGSAMSEEHWAPHKADLAAQKPFRDFRWQRAGTDGARHFMTISGDPVFDRNGVFIGYHGTGREITAEIKTNAELALGRQQFQLVLENMAQGITFFDGNQKLIVANSRYGEMYRLSAEQAHVGTSLSEILDHRRANGTLPNITQAGFMARRESLSRAGLPYDVIDELQDGRTISMHYQPLPHGGWLTTHEDITDRRHAEASIAFMAHHDALTQLANRIVFQDRLEQAIALAGRGGEFALICLDLDHFKAVNDTLGHPVGDALLQAVADRLRTCVREGDTVARLGGDEFAIIQLGIGQPEHAQLLSMRILDAIHDPFDLQGHRVTVGTSIGVAVAPGDGIVSEVLLKNADVALYLAKTEGRGTVRFFEPEMDARIQLRRTLESDLRDAIVHDQFELYYQPVINLISSRVTGFEALLRWHHPVRGLVSPADFIPVAEETGLIVAIGEWVLRMACFEAENWPVDIHVAVNLSPVQFKKGNLAATVREALTASGLQPNRLELEITESVLLHDTPDTLTALHQFRAMGIAVALDDFGTGYSSLSYLRSFPFDKIKIDQSFVRDLVKNKESMSIIRAVTGLGHSLRMKTTAEGVETLEQLDRLREEGCTEIQGFFFSRPIPANELPLLIERLHQMGRAAI